MAGWTSFFRQVEALPIWVREGIPLLLSTLLCLLLPSRWPLLTRLLVAWNVFAALVLFLTWGSMLSAQVKHIQQMANREDPGRTFTFLFVVGASLSSLLAVVALLTSSKSIQRGSVWSGVGVAMLAVVLTWLLLHTVFTLRYAHLYYSGAPGQVAGGLEFPGNEPNPDYLDFAYYAFVVGMTAQTADVGISGRRIRRLTLLHGVISFGFNTAVVALSINGLASLL